MEELEDQQNYVASPNGSNGITMNGIHQININKRHDY